MTEKETYINKYMKNLGLTREEAEEMWLDEQTDNLRRTESGGKGNATG